MYQYLESINDQKPYLNYHQPTEETVKVLETLNQFFAGKYNHSNFRYEKELRECNLHYSLESIKRIDKLLIKLRQKYPNFDETTIFSPSYPLNSDISLHLIAYYLGELVGRARQQAPIWYSNNREEERFKQVNFVPFEIMFAEFNTGIEANSAVIFNPMWLIYNALLTSDNKVESKHNTIWERIQKYIPKTLLVETNYQTSLKPAPVMQLQFDRQLAFAQLDKADIGYLQMIPPDWMKGDELYDQLQQLVELYTKGKVVWAHIVQANKLLFTPEYPYSCPAEIIYDPTGRTPPSYLAEIAHQLYDLKDTIPDNPELVDYAKHITDESTRIIGNNVPDIITSLPLKTTTMFIWRLHLPNGILNSAFPILISDTTEEVTVLPAKFWDKLYYVSWIENSYFKEDMYCNLRNLYINGNPWADINATVMPSSKDLIKALPSLSNKVDRKRVIDFEKGDFVKQCLFINIEEHEHEGTINYKLIIAAAISFLVVLGLIKIFFIK
ncbi:hypothetical protein [Psychrobacter sanguinis]|uniref:hypothetical protein n=1 Tax=Psychrobacter sanguinis TaxID=861445 RepID=UPI0028A934D6|nr:hypothetical protein [Psychrobacter sanguinis]